MGMNKNLLTDHDYELLESLCNVLALSGNETSMTQFLLRYIDDHKHEWKESPRIIAGEEFQDCIILVFGQPRTAIFAHIDSIGYMVRYGKQLIPVGGPDSEKGYPLKGRDSQGEIRCTLDITEEGRLQYLFEREIERGTELAFDTPLKKEGSYIESCYLDNRLGVWNALKVAETLQDGIIVFSCWEEHGGGSVPYLAKYIHENYGVKQALISDITWITEGVLPGNGAAISVRDKSIPRRSFVNKVVDMVRSSGIQFQLEVEEFGGSDGKELQASPYPFDWCFIGAAEQNVHTPCEKVHKEDIISMVEIYRFLMEKL